MKCKDCAHVVDCGRGTWKCGQAGSPKAGCYVIPCAGDYGTGCDWRDPDRLLPPLYHVTTEDRVPYIRRAGLLPSIGERSRETGEGTPAVYFFKSPGDLEGAMLNWLGESLPEDRKLYVLTAELPDSYAPLLKDAAGYETACEAPIPPDYLDFQDFDEWYGWISGKGAPAHATA